MAAAREAADADDQTDVELSPEEWRAWEVFDAMWSNWRVIAGFSKVQFQGLDYSAVEAVMRMLGIKHKHQRATFSMIRILEDEARKWRNK